MVVVANVGCVGSPLTRSCVYGLDAPPDGRSRVALRLPQSIERARVALIAKTRTGALSARLLEKPNTAKIESTFSTSSLASCQDVRLPLGE